MSCTRHLYYFLGLLFFLLGLNDAPVVGTIYSDILLFRFIFIFLPLYLGQVTLIILWLLQAAFVINIITTSITQPNNEEKTDETFIK